MKKGMTILTVMMILAVSSMSQADIFADQFSGGINPKYWTINCTTPQIYAADATQGDIRFTKIGTAVGGLNYIQLVLDISAITNGGAAQLVGDFDASVDFRNAVISGPGLNQVELHTGFADGRIFYDVRDGSNGSNNIHVWTGSYLSGFSTTATSGTLRIKRVGSTLSAYLDGALVYSLNHTAANLTYMGFSLQNNLGSNDFTQVTFDNFRMEGTNVLPAQACPSADLTGDCFVDMEDFALFASQWLRNDCVTPGWCGGADLDTSGDVAIEDLAELVTQWLTGI